MLKRKTFPVPIAFVIIVVGLSYILFTYHISRSWGLDFQVKLHEFTRQMQPDVSCRFYGESAWRDQMAALKKSAALRAGNCSSKIIYLHMQKAGEFSIISPPGLLP